VDEIVLFDVLSKEAIREIVTLRVGVVAKRLFGKGIELDLTDEALDFLAEKGHDPHYGARPLNRLIQTKILNPVASAIIASGLGAGDTVRVSVKDGDLCIDTKKAPKKVKSPLSARKTKTI
jgi:ATP-dependent Clp protease ATP-binding subunit ClpA